MPHRSHFVIAGFLTGTLDLAAALLLYYVKTGRSPWIIPRFIASGLFGKAAFSGSGMMTLAGLVLHFTISFAFTLLFFLLVPKIYILRRNWLFTAVLDGIFVWMVMNFIILPVSRVPSSVITVTDATTGMLVLIACFGLPLSLMVHRQQKKKPVSYHRLI